MVLISRKVDYAILVLYHLARSPIGASAREMSASYGLSRAFVANILKRLCQEGFVESQRGVHGGYRLAMAPSEITLDKVLLALDGPFQLMTCAPTEHEVACGLQGVCPVRNPLRMIHERLLSILTQATLEDMLEQEPELVALETNGHGFLANLSGQ